MNKKLIVSMVLTCVLLSAGCSRGPLDAKLDLSSLNTISESSDQIIAKMDSDELEISQWAVNTLGLSNIESLSGFRDQYGEKVTYRMFIKKAIEKRDEYVSGELKRLQELKPSWEATYNDLTKIKASNIQLGSSLEFMTRGHPLVSFDVTNGSKENVSQIGWKLELFLNGSNEPYTTYNVIDLYTFGGKNNGLLKGESVRRSVTVDTFFNRQNADKWVDLNAKSAKSKLVKVSVIPTSVKDFNDEEFITGDINAALTEIVTESKTIEKAKKYL